MSLSTRPKALALLTGTRRLAEAARAAMADQIGTPLGLSAEQAAEAVVRIADSPSSFHPLYPDAMPLFSKIERIAAAIDGGRKPFVAVGAAHMLGPQGLPALWAHAQRVAASAPVAAPMAREKLELNVYRAAA